MLFEELVLKVEISKKKWKQKISIFSKKNYVSCKTSHILYLIYVRNIGMHICAKLQPSIPETDDAIQLSISGTPKNGPENLHFFSLIP